MDLIAQPLGHSEETVLHQKSKDFLFVILSVHQFLLFLGEEKDRLTIKLSANFPVLSPVLLVRLLSVLCPTSPPCTSFCFQHSRALLLSQVLLSLLATLTGRDLVRFIGFILLGFFPDGALRDRKYPLVYHLQTEILICFYKLN